MHLPLDQRARAKDLEQRRLQHRATRIDRVLHALRDRAIDRGNVGHVPVPLRDAIRGFERELEGVRARLSSFDR